MSWIPLPVLTWHPISQPPTEAKWYRLRFSDGYCRVAWFENGAWYFDKPSRGDRWAITCAADTEWSALLEQPL